ncbi:DUF6920 family protein [Pareuzebyella sediminis]|uniref:DUF6920 family protein n=1 Tax=Pareuzebyella sediminis TaxID=2607998 RepID=UPI0011F050FC|nr:DUF6544 family protein [Pareuzebyella sediminis]
MRIVLILVIAIHGIIHLFGFLKAFGLSDFSGISRPISKPFGLLWLSVFLLLAFTAILLSKQSSYWRIVGISGVIVSQILVTIYWSDAKFGTLLNIIILVSILLAYSTFRFQSTVRAETIGVFMNSRSSGKKILTSPMISNLPPIVQKWLNYTNVIGKEMVHHVYLEQDLQMLMRPGQKEWSKAKAKQYFTVEPPAFIWSVDLKMNPWLKVVGRDKFENGQGEMTIKMLSFLSMACVKDNVNVNQATLQRYLAETVWFPSAVLSPYIKWKPINDTTAEATMSYNGTQGSGEFHFDKTGYFKKFVAMRYKEANDTIPKEWTVTAIKTEERSGIKIPVGLQADWKLADSTWTWLKLKISNIEYNPKATPMTDNEKKTTPSPI